ncbi:DUF2690 domain-containing protein [Streptomyces sp. NPDC014864]|uniref:helix-turn-helix domain-containing protein n=1 Tax=Streptomyces sp. NPDC014864 TaxID=3364924 RepID=UPI0036FC1C9E
MPRWKALPDELDPQVREFASQLRRLVDRSGLSVAALADRTGYSKTSWERYLGGRLLAPKGAIVALAEVTGTNPVHLTTMWELAERAWSRAEMRHDRTMEAIRISQARAALGESGAMSAADGKGVGTVRRSGSATVAPEAAGPAGTSPTVPSQPTAADADVRDAVPRTTPPGPASSPGTGPGAGTGSDVVSASASAPVSEPAADAGADPGTGSATAEPVNSWGLAGYRGPSPAGGRASGSASSPSGGPTRTATSPSGAAARPPAGPGAYTGAGAGAGTVPAAGTPQTPRPGANGARRQQALMFLAGLVGVLVLIGAVFYLTGGGAEKPEGAKKSPAASPSVDPNLPPGVKCSGASCTGKDAEGMGCSGEFVTTAQSATVGTTVVEVRYSKTCGAAWGRITQAAQGDEVRVTVGSRQETGTITTAGDTIAYTPMVAVKDAARMKACATLASGQQGCTR